MTLAQHHDASGYKILTLWCFEATIRPSTRFSATSLSRSLGCPSPYVAYLDMLGVVLLVSHSRRPFVRRHSLYHALNADFNALTA